MANKELLEDPRTNKTGGIATTNHDSQKLRAHFTVKALAREDEETLHGSNGQAEKSKNRAGLRHRYGRYSTTSDYPLNEVFQL